MPAIDENVIKRIMPHSLEAEQSVIGSMFIDTEAIAAATEQISGEDFYNRQYGIVFDTIVELNNEGKPVDFVTLQDRLRSREDVPPEVSGLDFLTNLIASVPTSANIKYYAGIVAEKATLRRLIRTNEEIANTCYSGKESLDTILESTESKINEVVQKKNVKEFVPIRTVVMNAMDKIEKASKLHGTVTGIATGFIDLDYRTAGMQPSDLVLIAAGFLGSEAYVTEQFGVERNARTNVATPEGSYQTSQPDIFTAGDMHRGQSLVVWAIAEGRAAAKAVDESLMGYSNL